MGASRGRLARQLLTEGLLLSAISGVVALGTVLLLKNAAGTNARLVRAMRMAKPGKPRWHEPTPHIRERRGGQE
jgi:hypothetical protein